MLWRARGKLYSRANASRSKKQRRMRSSRTYIAAYRVESDSEWMSPETKAQAKDKLAHCTVKIGYPDKPRDFSALEYAERSARKRDASAAFGLNE